MNDAILTERLESATSTRLDILAFLASFVAGIALYFVLRNVGVHQIIITAVIILVMLFYAMIVARVPRLRLRLDQAGDNAYYLGLLFTLASMAVALYDFSTSQLDASAGMAAESDAKRIIGNFGIALGTTIAGIFLRVVLHQMRVDPADVEGMTRIELAEAAKRVKASLDAVSTDMTRLLDEMRQRTGDQLGHLVEEVQKTLKEFTESTARATKGLIDTTIVVQQEAVAKLTAVMEGLVKTAQEAEAAVTRLRQVEPPPPKLANRLEKVSDVLKELTGNAEQLGVRLSDATSKVSQDLLEAAKSFVEATKTAKLQNQESLNQLSETVAVVKDALASLGNRLEEDRKQLIGLEAQSKKSAEAALEVQDAASRVLGTFIHVTRGLTDLINRRT